MATPKKGSRPIKITLTENQLSDIISQTARTRKGLKAESLEDRIAPSMIGAPIDPSLVPLPDSGTDPIAPEKARGAVSSGGGHRPAPDRLAHRRRAPVIRSGSTAPGRR